MSNIPPPKTSSKEESAATLIAFIIEPFLYGWLLMLGMGAANSIWASVPAVGYWAAVQLWLLAMIISTLLGFRRGRS